MESKKCKDCGTEKLISEFVIDKNYKAGVKNTCKNCKNSRAKELDSYKTYNKRVVYSTEERRNKKLLQQKEWRRKNKKKISSSQRSFYLNNKEKIKKWHQKNYKEKKECIVVNRKPYQSSTRYKALSKFRKKTGINELKDFYVKDKLRRLGFTNEQLDALPELIEIQRITIKFKRLCKTL